MNLWPLMTEMKWQFSMLTLTYQKIKYSLVFLIKQKLKHDCCCRFRPEADTSAFSSHSQRPPPLAPRRHSTALCMRTLSTTNPKRGSVLKTQKKVQPSLLIVPVKHSMLSWQIKYREDTSIDSSSNYTIL